jgi:hypothetical protein
MTNQPSKAAVGTVKRIDTKAHAELDLGKRVSQDTEEALRRIDANLRNAEEKAGSLLVA